MVKTWLTLSKANEPYEKQITCKDLFKPTEKFVIDNGISSQIQLRKLEIMVAKRIYQALYRANLTLHPSIKKRYMQQSSCIWCGGKVKKIEDIENNTYDIRCEDCLFVYEEQ